MPEAPHDDLHAGLHVGHRQRVDAQRRRRCRRRPGRSPSRGCRPAPSGRRAGPGWRGWWWSRRSPGRRRPARTAAVSASPGSTWLTPRVCSRISSRCSASSSSVEIVIRGAGQVGGLVADVELVDDPVAAVLTDVVEHPGQDAGVDQVTGDLDGLAHVHGAPPGVGRDGLDRPGRTLHNRAVVAEPSPPSPVHGGDQEHEAADERGDQAHRDPGREGPARKTTAEQHQQRGAEQADPGEPAGGRAARAPAAAPAARSAPRRTRRPRRARPRPA